MSTEDGPKTVSARGGCLDALVGVATFGKCGVETTAVYPAEKIVPSKIRTDGEAFPIDPNSPIGIALRTRDTAFVDNFDTVNSPKISRKIVRNKRLS